VGMVDDSTATYWNPAGLTGIKDFEIMLAEEGSETAALGLGTNAVASDYFFLSGGMTLPGVGSLGLSVMRFGDGGIPETVPCSTCPGGFNQTNTFSTDDTGVFVSYGRSVARWLDLGATVKALFGGTNGLTVQSSVGISGDANYSYFGLDLGAILKFGAFTPALMGLTLGLNLQDLINSGVKWSDTPSNSTESVSTNPKTGLAYKMPFDFLKQNYLDVNLAVDLDPTLYAPAMVLHYGAEVWYKEVLAFRGGFMQFTDSAQSTEPSLGASVRIYTLQVDYAYIYDELTPLEYIDLAVRW